ncbi:MAG: pyrroline-5-carboxylate reductase [Bacteroidota bacterium]
MKQKITILGGGNLGGAIALGLVNKGLYTPADITVTRRSIDHLKSFRDQGFNISSDNVMSVSESEVILLCVQPKQVQNVLEEIGSFLNADKHILVSTVTGVKTGEISATLPDDSVPVVRAMPNTAIAIGQSMTCICTENAGNEVLELVKSLFAALGKSLVIEERLMQAATVLGASGIAFFLRYIRAATQGGIQMGFDAEDAQFIAMQTAIGASSLVQETEHHPESEIDRVTTPQGCTIEGLNEMEHQGLSSAVIKGLLASFHKINSIK